MYFSLFLFHAKPGLTRLGQGPANLTLGILSVFSRSSDSAALNFLAEIVKKRKIQTQFHFSLENTIVKLICYLFYKSLLTNTCFWPLRGQKHVFVSTFLKLFWNFSETFREWLFLLVKILDFCEIFGKIGQIWLEFSLSPGTQFFFSFQKSLCHN